MYSVLISLNIHRIRSTFGELCINIINKTVTRKIICLQKTGLSENEGISHFHCQNIDLRPKGKHAMVTVD